VSLNWVRNEKVRGEKDDEKWSFPCLEDKQGNKLVPLKKKKTFPHYSQ